MECFISLPSMSIAEKIQRVPQDLLSVLYGELHMALNYCNMEYSIWRFSAAIWIALQSTLNEHYKCCLMYSIRLLFYAIWSLFPGVLQIFAIHVICRKNLKSSIRLVFSAQSSTPYGTKNRPYGVLHVTRNSDHMEYSMGLQK